MLSQFPPSSFGRNPWRAGRSEGKAKSAVDSSRNTDRIALEIQTEAATLGARLAARIPGGVAYQPKLLDSGAEAMEAVVGHAYLLRLEALKAVHEEIQAKVSEIWLQVAAGEPLEVPEDKALVDFLDDLEQRNLGALESFAQFPVMLAFQSEKPVLGGGALGPRLRNACRNACEGVVEPRVVNLEPLRGDRIEAALNVHRCHFRVPRWEQGRIEVDVRTESLVFACIVGPSAGGDGICALAPEVASALVFRSSDLPLVIEETRIGCGAEGFYSFARTLLAQARPEYVLVSKVMGGWGSKIGAAMIRADIHRPEYEMTLDEGCSDAFSLGVALSVLVAMEASSPR